MHSDIVISQSDGRPMYLQIMEQVKQRVAVGEWAPGDEIPSIRQLAMALRVPATRIGAIVKGEQAVTADTALRLTRFFGTSPEFWVNLQAIYDLTKARLEDGGAIERDVQPRAA